MKVGVVSDTHGFFDPRLEQMFSGVDAIVHAGDAGSRHVLDELSRIAPLHAVRGNVDGAELKLPPSLTLEFGGLGLEVLHILSVPQSELEVWSRREEARAKSHHRIERWLASFADETRVVVFGHSHWPCLVELDGRLFFNPGSAGKKRFSQPRCCGLLEIAEGAVRASIGPLESYNGALPEAVRIRL
jgi:uncharacterized protein